MYFFFLYRYVVYMDANGDTQGNYTLIGRQPYESTNHEDGLYPVGVFHIPRNHSTIPVSEYASLQLTISSALRIECGSTLFKWLRLTAESARLAMSRRCWIGKILMKRLHSALIGNHLLS